MLLSYVMLVEKKYNQNLKPVQDQAIARAEKVCVKVQLKTPPTSRTVFPFVLLLCRISTILFCNTKIYEVILVDDHFITGKTSFYSFFAKDIE